MRKGLTSLIVIFIMLMGYACSDKPKIRGATRSVSGDSEGDQDKMPEEEQGGDLAPEMDLPPSLGNCAKKGLAWRPEGIKYGDETCLGKLVTDFCCSKGTISRRFPGNWDVSENNSIKNLWEKNEAKGLKAYGCSLETVEPYTDSGLKTYVFHFAGLVDDVPSYAYINISWVAIENKDVTELDTCPALPTSEELFQVVEQAEDEEEVVEGESEDDQPVEE